MNHPLFNNWIAVAAALLCAVSVTMVASGAAASPWDSDETPAEVVDNLSEQVETLQDSYLVPAVLEDRYRLESRFNEAKVAYLLGDYRRASILFVAVVDSEDVRQFDSYREALYLLGDSLLEERNFRAGREYFRQVVDLGPGAFYQPAIVKLLEIASRIDDYDGVDELYDLLDDLEEVSPALHYTRGKTLYEEGRTRSAQPWFQRAARDSEYEFTARYFEGVTLAASGELTEADEVFEDLTGRVAPDDEAAEIIELAHLARGRLAYEREEFDEAIDHYLQVSRTSTHFTRGLYELTWALVAQGNYRSALRNLDILMISDPDPRFVPEAQALMADMAMRLGEYDEARSWFGELVETFSPVRRELRDFIDEYDELDEFFVGLVRQELEGLQPDFLPDEVTEWVEDDDLMVTSRQLIADGTITQEDIDETYEAIEEIEATLEMGSAIEVFPTLSEGWIQGMELEARLVDLEEQLLDWELQQVRPLMSSADEERLDEIEEELQELQRREDRTPRTRQELEDRDQRIQESFSTLRDEIDRVAFEIEGLEETLDAISEYTRRQEDSWSEEERREIEEVRAEIDEELTQLEDERRQLSRHLEQTERAFGARDESLVEHRELRREIQELQAERAEIVDARSPELAAEQAAEAQQIAEARRRLPDVRDDLDDYFRELDSIVDRRMDEIQVTLDSERAELASYQSELDDWNEDTEQTVAELAMINFVQADSEFENLIRRGHVGLVDVDWQQLDDASRQRQELEDEKMETEELLREAFPDVN